MLATIRSRVAPVPFRRLRRSELETLTGDPVAARAALGDAGRAERLATDADAAARRRGYLELARACFADPGFDPAAAARQVADAAAARSAEAGLAVEEEGAAQLEGVEDKRERRAIEKRTDERAKRTARRAQTDELREAVDVVGLWYRDLMATTLGGEGAVINSDVADELAQDAKSGSPAEAARAVGIVLEARRSLELNVQPALAVEAMFHRLRLAPAGG